jgi:hypothetical protein
VFYALIGKFVMPHVDIPPGTPLHEQIVLVRDTQMGLITFVIITLLVFYLLYLIFSRIIKEKGVRKELMFLFLVLLGYPFVYAVERGNNIILALVFCFLFLLGYRSENRFIRYASYIALACAAGLKIYPAIFGLLILRERRYREAAVCVAIAAVIMLVPFLLTDGNPLILFENIFYWADMSLGFTNISQITIGLLHEMLGIPEGTASLIRYALLGIFTVLSFIVILFDRGMKYWKVIALIGCNLVLGFGLGVQYQIIYMLPAMLYFMASEREMTKENLFYTICFAMMMVLIPGVEIALFSDIIGTLAYPSAVIGAMESAFVIVVAAALLREGLGRLYRDRFRNAGTKAPASGGSA